MIDDGAKSALLLVENLVKTFQPRGRGFSRSSGFGVQAVSDVSFRIDRGETFSIVGESGCGKSTTARCVVRIESPTSGSIRFDGQELTGRSYNQLRSIRPRFQMVFQDPQASLNPRQRVREIIAEPLQIRGDSRADIADRVAQLAQQVQLRSDDLERFPHQFSGGQRQRIGIARALALQPELLVLDEPVSALDVSVQAQIIRLLQQLRDELGLAYLLIAHNLAVVRHVSDRVGVMYLGKLVEMGTSEDLYVRTLHPYTQALISAAPIADPDVENGRKRIMLSGDVPSPLAPPSGCRFRTRCWKATAECAEVEPVLIDLGGGHMVACHHPEELNVLNRSTSNERTSSND